MTILHSPEKLFEILNEQDNLPHESVVGSVSLDPLKSWNDEIEKSFSSTLSIENLESSLNVIENSAISLHQKLLEFVFISTSLKPLLKSISWKPIEKDFSTHEGANQLSMKVAELFTSFQASSDENGNLSIGEGDDYIIESTLSELLRACKNIIRWKRKVHIDSKSTSQLVNPVRRLQSVGMIMLFLHLLNFYSGYFDSKNHSPLDDIARYASLSLFHAIFGQMEAEATRGRLEFVETLNGIPILMKMLLRENPVPLMLSLVRNVHNLVGNTECIIEKMDKALESLSESEENVNYSLLFVMVTKLALTIRSNPPFPGSDVSDRRSDLAIEILRVLFILSNHSKASIKDLEKTNKETMTQIGLILVDILLLPNKDLRAYECKLSAIQLLMNSPVEYGQFLMKNNAIQQLLTIFELQLDKVVVELDGQPHGARDAVLILPILVVLCKYASANYYIRKMVKEKLFPPHLEDAFVEKVKRERALVPYSSNSELGAKNMKPIDAPKGTLRWKMIRLLTWSETNVKRYAGELLWSLFDKNSTELILRVGFGNAVHLLSIKGLVPIPEQSSASVMRK